MYSSDAWPSPAGGSQPGPPAQVELGSRIRSLELSLIASDFRPLAGGMGRLSATVPPGIYQVVARAGPIVERKLIKLASGETYRDDDIAVGFPAPAPVQNTTTSHEYHQYAAEEASRRVADTPGPPSGLVLVVRDVRGLEGPPLEPLDVAPFQLLDAQLRPLADFAGGWEVRGPEAVATWGTRLPPGGYALRTDPARMRGSPRQPRGGQAFDQSIWLSHGWQTIVFITTGPGGPRSSAASVHMTDLGMNWMPFEVDVGLALELAIWGLREGRSAVPDDLLNLLLGSKFANPMLGIVGAHSLLLRQRTDLALLDVVLNNLEGMVAGHPDVLALRWMMALRRAAEAGADAGAPALPTAAPEGGVGWPPMLLASYRALIAMDAVHATALADGAPAERAASNLLVQGIWTSWLPLPPLAAEIGDVPAVPHADFAGGAEGTGRPATPSGARSSAGRRPTAVGVLPLVGRQPELLASVPLDDPATARVAAYLTALAALEGSRGRTQRFATLSPQEIGLATTLPSATVDRALANIAAALPPPLPPAGGGEAGPDRDGGPPPHRDPGPGAGLLSLLVLSGLLLAGALGGAAWCATAQECTLLGGEATPTAAAQPTDEPQETRPRATQESPARTAPPTPAPPSPSPSPTMSPSPSPSPTLPPPTPLFLRHPLQVTFDDVFLGRNVAEEALTIFAGAPVPLQPTIIQPTPGAFSVEPGCEWLERGADLFECSLALTFAPSAPGDYNATLAIFTFEPEPRMVRLVGRAFTPIE